MFYQINPYKSIHILLVDLWGSGGDSEKDNEKEC